jgi:NTP pyrophosphatase (non-canonical NTP hydrolase)
MNLNEYQDAALATAGIFDNKETAIAVWALGVGGEAGEGQELVKKHLGHGHPLDTAAVKKELGDVLWYIAALAHELGLSLEDIAAANLAKLRGRYPDGFSSEASQNRDE